MNEPISRIGIGLLMSIGAMVPIAAEQKLDFPPPESEVVESVFAITDNYFSGFQHQDTGVLYGARLSGKDRWTSPSEVLEEKPHPWGYGSRIADTVLHTGHMLVALLDAREARPDPFLKAQIRRHFEALKWIGSLPETHPKPGKPDLVGLVPRGPHPDDPSAYYDDSSMDQHTTFIISLALFSQSDLADESDKAWIKETLEKVGRRLEKHNWAIMRADGVTQAHVGFSWKGQNSGHASILLPSVLALHRGTGNPHWLALYEHFLAENEGRRWEQVHPGPQININGHPIYANQNAFRVQAWLRMEPNPERKKVIAGLLRQSVEMQLSRDFPGEFYRKYHSDEEWKALEQRYSWQGSELKGAVPAWERFDTTLFEANKDGLAALAHVRFPLGGFHMALLSEDPKLTADALPHVWKILTSVDLESIAAGETHYLFSVVALHLYALYFREPELFVSNIQTESRSQNHYGPELRQSAVVGIGQVMDVAIKGEHAYAVGQGTLHILDIRDIDQLRPVGKLSGLGSVRQIAVQESTAYITSRQDGLFLVDISIPENPVLLESYDTVEFATGVAVSGNLLFVACRHYGVELIDVSDPKNPRHLSTIRTGEAQSITSRGNFLYVGVWATSEIVTVDVSDPYHPHILSRAPLDGYGDGVAVDGNYLYAATGHHSAERPRKNPGDPGFGKGHGLEVFDLTDPAKPTFVSRAKFPPLYEIGNDMWSVRVANGFAFVADTYNGLFIVDVRNPRALKFAGHHQLPYIESRKQHGFVGGLALANDSVFLAGGYTDLHVIDATGLAKVPDAHSDTPPKIHPTPEQNEEERWQVYRPRGQVYAADLLSETRAVVACGSAGIHFVDFSKEPVKLTEHATKGFATDVSVTADMILVAESLGGLSVFARPDGSTNTRFQLLSRFQMRGKPVRQVEYSESTGHAMLQVGANQLVILDLSDPTSPRQILKDARHGLLYGDQMMRGLIDDRYTCVFWHVSGFHWYDLKAKPRPVFSGDNYPERTGSANGLTAFDGKTLATIRGGYLLLDRQERRPLSELDSFQVEDLRTHLGVPLVYDHQLYAANRASGRVTVLDIADPEDPKLVDQIETPGNPARVSATKERLLIPNGYEGLLILDR